MKQTLWRVALCILTASPAALAQVTQTPSGDFEWRFAVRPNIKVKSTITAHNRCRGRHQFEMELQNLRFMRLQETSFQVGGGQDHVVPVEFDSTGLAGGLYQGTVIIKCTSCRREPTCTQDRERLHVLMTVVPWPANWSSIRPELKESSTRPPTTGPVAPEKKP